MFDINSSAVIAELPVMGQMHVNSQRGTEGGSESPTKNNKLLVKLRTLSYHHQTPVMITCLSCKLSSSDRGSGRRPLFQLKAALPACVYIRGAEWPIFVITFWVVTVTVTRPNLVYA